MKIQDTVKLSTGKDTESVRIAGLALAFAENYQEEARTGS